MTVGPRGGDPTIEHASQGAYALQPARDGIGYEITRGGSVIAVTWTRWGANRVLRRLQAHAAAAVQAVEAQPAAASALRPSATSLRTPGQRASPSD